jgi:hypothetical protein
MSSIQGELRDGKLVLIIDASDGARKSAALSSSGKTRVLATTHGFTRFGDIAVSVNATLPK